MMKWRKKYWSNTKIADFIRGTEKPKIETFDGWKAWREEARKTHPIRYWIAERFLTIAQDYFMAPMDIWNSIRCYVRNRWVSKSHALTSSKNNIKRGEWCDLSERILYCNFDELLRFVKVECAHMHNMGKKNKPKESLMDGIEYLRWQGRQEGGMSEAAPIIIDLCYWWTVKRPQRKDPYEIEIEDGDYSKVWELSDQYHEEDNEMLKKLIDIRGHLWT